MIAHLSSMVRRGVLTLGVLAASATLSAAAPLLLPVPADAPSPAALALQPIGDSGPQAYSNGDDDWQIRRGRRDWTDTRAPGERWRERRDWRDRDRDGWGWRDRRGWRDRDRWGWDDDWRRHRRSGFYFSIEPNYRYVEPRRQYRATGLSRAHIAWCYDRYRSYRAWDNTFKPNYGPRRQCYSPYI